jgi:hypothetical protein
VAGVSWVTEPPVTRRDEAQLYELDDIAGT